MFVYFFVPFFLPIIAAYLGWERIVNPRLQQYEFLKGSLIGAIPIVITSLLIYGIVIYPALQKAKDEMCVDCGLVGLPHLTWFLGTVSGLVLYTTLNAATTNKIVYPSTHQERRAFYLFPVVFFAGLFACGWFIEAIFETGLIGLNLYLISHIYVMYKIARARP